jgi:Zn-dependent peptidase ImmA (M78 family)
MKIIRTASGSQIKLSKEEWEAIGKQAEWIKRSDEEEVEVPLNDVPVERPKPMPFSPSELEEEKKEETVEDQFSDATVTLEIKDTRYGKLIFAIVSNTTPATGKELKALGYKAFKNKITNDWTWSKIVNDKGSQEVNPVKLEAIKAELSEKGIDVSPLNLGLQDVSQEGEADIEGITEETKEEQDKNVEVPEEMIYWHNELEAANKLSPKERAAKYTEIIQRSLEQVAAMAESDETNEQAQEIVKRLLEASSKFHNYSFRNSLIIAILRPDASYVTNKDNWKRMGRVLKKEAKPIPIMFPIKKKPEGDDAVGLSAQEIKDKTRVYFGFGSAYAYEDTEAIPGFIGKRGKYKGQGPFEPPEWDIDSNEATEWLTQLYNAAYAWATDVKKFKVEIQDTGSKGGWATPTGEIVISDKHDGVRKVTTLFHEIAHQIIHFDPDFRRKDATKQDKETDAESVAYIVASHYHIESKNSSVYLAGYGANKKSIMGRLDHVKKAAMEMFEGIDQAMVQMDLIRGKLDSSKEVEPTDLPTVDNPVPTTQASAGNFFGKLGLFGQKQIVPMPFLYAKADAYIEDIKRHQDEYYSNSQNVDPDAPDFAVDLRSNGRPCSAQGRSNVQEFLTKLGRSYHDDIPIDSITNALEQNNLLLIQEDGKKWAGFISTQGDCGHDNAPMVFDLGVDLGNGYVLCKSQLVMTICTMPSGKLEMVAYLS